MTVAPGSALSLTNRLSPINFDQLVDAKISKPGRYLGNELGAVKKSWDSSFVHWALTYPELYEIGVSNLGHTILYSIINEIPGQLCDRAYLPGADLAQKIREGTQTFNNFII